MTSRYLTFFMILLLLPAAWAQEASPQAEPPEVQLSAAAKKFTFTKVDLDFLRQVDAFDKYIADKGWVYEDPAISDYVEHVGRSVVPADTPEHVTWRFRVLRDPVPNAFALPNGSVYINSGLLSRLQNEAQLAGVLAHESTHVFNRHTYLSYHDMRKKSVGLHVLQAAMVVAAMGGAPVGILNGAGNMIALVVMGTFFGYRRELEHEADVYAVNMLNKAGYDAAQVPAALDSLKTGPEVDLSDENVFWSDHPKLADRVRDTTAIAKQLASEKRGRVDAEPYLAATKGAVRHDVGLAILLGRPRTAVAVTHRLISLEPNNAEYHALAGDAYRALGGRSPQPLPEERTDDAKKKTRKMLGKMTSPEFEKALLDAPGGKEQMRSNLEESERAYMRALELDAGNAAAQRGLGFLREAQNQPADAVARFNKYLELAPEAKDANQIRRRVEGLTKKLAADQKTTQGEGR